MANKNIEQIIADARKIIVSAREKNYLNAEKAFDYWFKRIGNRDSILLLACELLTNNDTDGLKLLDAYSRECAISGCSTGSVEFLVFSGYAAQFLQKEKGDIRKSVYVIELDNSSVKIGVSQNVENRFKQISNASGMAITKSYISPKTKYAFKIEKTLHKNFQNSRRDSGEFFNASFNTVVDCLKKTLKDLAYLETA